MMQNPMGMPSSPQPSAPAQAQSPAQPPQAQGQPAQGQPGQQPYNPQILQALEQHLNTLPDPQKAYLVQYLTPEFANLIGIVNGKECYDYFAKYADPKKQLVVVPRQAQGQPAQGQPQNAQAPMPSQAQVAEAGANVNQQPQNPPAKSIMGV